jgi:Sec-independent protein translocase protein TatA
MTDLGLVLVVILILAVIWRGPKTLPKIGQALGRGVKEARREAADIRGDVPPRDDERDDTPVPPG